VASFGGNTLPVFLIIIIMDCVNYAMRYNPLVAII